MTLAERLSTYDEKYWDFSEYRNDPPLEIGRAHV